jgi:hypothetical protein
MMVTKIYYLLVVMASLMLEAMVVLMPKMVMLSVASLVVLPI